MQPQDDEEQAPPRASAWSAVGAVTLVAVLVAGGLVGWIRLGADGTVAAPESGLDEDPPEELPGGIAPGSVPPEVEQAVDGPVLAVVILDDLPDGLDGCQWWGDMDERTLEHAVATPDGIQIRERGFEILWMEEEFGPAPRPMPLPAPEQDVPMPEPGEFPPTPTAGPEPFLTPDHRPAPPPGPREERQEVLVTCLATPTGRGWNADSAMSMPVRDLDMNIGMGMGTSMSCCDDQGLATATSSVTVPDGATWMLQDRGRYWLAFPVTDEQVTTVTWRYREGRFGAGPRSTHVLWVDDNGEVIDERFLNA